MEMEMGIGSLSSYLNHPPSSSGGQQALSYYYYPPPYASPPMTSINRRDVDEEPTAAAPPSRPRSSSTARKDRHSKIYTVGGMRARRMRLPLDVARRFFSLQDKLGFDKASKTVQWLLDMSAAGITHLAASMSISMSEEDGSGSVLLDSNDHVMAADAETNSCKQQQMPQGRTRAGRRSNNGAPALPDKESRARARKRARERTVVRNRLRSLVSTAVADEAPAPTPARQVVPVIQGGSSFGSYYEEQPWELGGVVFAKPRHHY